MQFKRHKKNKIFIMTLLIYTLTLNSNYLKIIHKKNSKNQT